MLCLVGLIASHLKCDVIGARCDYILCLVGLIASHLKCDVMFGWGDCILSKMWCDQVIEDANAMTVKRDNAFHLKCKCVQGT